MPERKYYAGVLVSSVARFAVILVVTNFWLVSFYAEPYPSLLDYILTHDKDFTIQWIISFLDSFFLLNCGALCRYQLAQLLSWRRYRGPVPVMQVVSDATRDRLVQFLYIGTLLCIQLIASSGR
jgi:hypothetical protein